jgi:NADPH:quinone reductase-like Zn-dependent oxidoreductase
MKAVRIHQYGGPEVLKYEDAPRPNPAPGDVLIRVHAAAINPVDWKVRQGYLRERVKHSLPLILGWDVSGVVEETAQLGANEVIDYQTVKFEDVARDVDVVLDTIGGDTQQRSWKVLKQGGILVSIVSPPSANTAREYGVRHAFVFIEPDPAVLAEMAKLVDAGKLRAVVETVLPLAEARRGQEISQSAHARGKIVLRVL